jgi:DNA gyrase subunit A
VVGQRPVDEKDEIMIITRKGIVIRTSVDGISTMGRNTQGVKLINLDEGDVVSTIARIARASDIEDDAVAEGEG